jgi:hypothetical protein
METGEPGLQVDVGLIGPGDETDRARTGAEFTSCGFFGGDHQRMVGKP